MKVALDQAAVVERPMLVNTFACLTLTRGMSSPY